MMLGNDAGLPPKDGPRGRRPPATRPEGVLFAMASPLETHSSFRWPSWLAPMATVWDKPRTANTLTPPRRSL
ncbi:MAG: hypothetical protein ACREDK_07770 [Thermoplasmata archaeon]